MKEKDAIYLKEDFTDKDGERAGELENRFAEMDGWNMESNAATMLSNLGIKEEHHYKQLKELLFRYECEHPETHLTAYITFASFGPNNKISLTNCVGKPIFGTISYSFNT